MVPDLMLVLKGSIACIILAIGLGSAPGDFLYLFRRPMLLARSLLAMYVLVPLAAVVVVLVLPVPPPIRAALLVLAVSAGAPLLPKKLKAVGNPEYVFSLLVLSSLLAIVLVPAWVALLGRWFGGDAGVGPLVVAIAIGKAFLLPLAIGMLLRLLLKSKADWLSPRLLTIAGITLLCAALILLVAGWHVFTQMGWQGLSGLAVFLVAALAIGHLLGGPSAGDRTVLAIACATRHIGIAVLVATHFPGTRTVVLVAGYVVTAAVVSMTYLHWRRKSMAT
jgi:predicted Na+-dependent transporter